MTFSTLRTAIFICLIFIFQISETIPLVSEKLPVACLNEEYLGDAVFTSKILDLASKYSFMRRTRPDGNCFFRAFAYAYLEHLISNKDDYEKFRQLAETSKDKLVELGFPRLTLEDFHETVCHLRLFLRVRIVALIHTFLKLMK